jgi:hypothetical protein
MLVVGGNLYVNKAGFTGPGGLYVMHNASLHFHFITLVNKNLGLRLENVISFEF